MKSPLIIDIRDNKFPSITIEENTWIIFRNLDPTAHSAETLPGTADYFNAGPLLPGESSSPVLFSKQGRFNYICRFHHGMSGSVHVVKSLNGVDHIEHTEQPNGGHVDHVSHHDQEVSHVHTHIKHFHGFVTGGRSSKQCFFSK